MAKEASTGFALTSRRRELAWCGMRCVEGMADRCGAPETGMKSTKRLAEARLIVAWYIAG